MGLHTGDTLTIEATVVHVVALGGGETNYCLALPSGRTTWVLASQLGDLAEPAAPELDPAPAQDEPAEPAETKHRPSPRRPAPKATAPRRTRAKATR